MFPAFYIFVAMVVIGVILYIHDRLTYKSGEREEGIGERGEDTRKTSESQDDCSDECCGANDVCPSEMMLKHFNEPAEYYEDEELDDFRGRDANEYNDDELEQWRDVLYTLRHDELLSWERAIKKRGIALPDIIKEELISLANEGTKD
ncbi:MAG: phospholipase [Muribaculaceae bacterium]|nr:phospholipase [Muribaculaceae bacterium]